MGTHVVEGRLPLAKSGTLELKKKKQIYAI